MAIATGTRFGPYEVTGLIGAGGMGEVYRATDTTLGRTVAIKTLPAALAADADRLARFEREAKLLATLNHPHIAAVYSLDRHEGTLYLAMELVEGVSLEEKLKAGALPVAEVLPLAHQIAQALEAAHEKGVIHRDLKPANIMLTPGGQVKVLDFGLAKAFSTDPVEASPGRSPALSLAMTQQGIILGTAGYMAPEQASGQPTDQRSDVWAFGVVVYEMLTGLPLFRGESVPHILADVLKTEPDWNRLPPDLHPRLKALLARCLTKKPRNRYAGIADARVDIEAVLSDPEGATPRRRDQTGAARPPLWQRLGLAAGLLVAGVAIAGLAAWALRPDPETAPLTRFAHVIPRDHVLRTTVFGVLALSPDGRRVAYNTRDGFRLRELDELEARLIPGTEDIASYPFFSVDSQSLAYLALQPERAIRQIGIQGGASVAVSSTIVGALRGMSWAADGNIYFALGSAIFRVAATGGTPEPLIQAAEGETLSSPRLLPDGDSLLFDVSETGDRDDGRVVVQSLATAERKTLIQGGGDARYVPTGHLVYAFEDGLFGIAFDLETLSISGGPVPLAQGVMRSSLSGDANYGIAANGTLAYLVGQPATRSVVWVDREGRETPINLPPRDYNYVQLSPDGTRLALDARDEEADIWIFDLERETPQRLTFDPGFNRGPLWSPVDDRVVFTRQLDNTEEIFWQAADGSGVPEALTHESGRQVFPNDITPDGTALLFMDVNAPRDIWLMPIGEEGAEPEALIATPANEYGAQVSPDGRWLAYQSDESGQAEIYVRPFPAVDTGRWQVSRGGGTRPRWSRDGRELFYFVPATGSGSGALMAATIDADTTFRWSAPTQLFAGDYVAPNDSRQTYDVSLDGERFLMLKDFVGADDGPPSQIIVVENWFEELKRLVPTER